MVLEQFGADLAEAIFQSNVDADSTGRQRVLARLTAHSPEIAAALLTLLEKKSARESNPHGALLFRM